MNFLRLKIDKCNIFNSLGTKIEIHAKFRDKQYFNQTNNKSKARDTEKNHQHLHTISLKHSTRFSPPHDIFM